MQNWFNYRYFSAQYVIVYIFSKNIRIIQLYNGDRNQTSESKEKDYFGSVSIYLIYDGL